MKYISCFKYIYQSAISGFSGAFWFLLGAFVFLLSIYQNSESLRYLKKHNPESSTKKLARYVNLKILIKTRQLPSMIHSARPTVTPVTNIAYCCFVFLDLKSGDVRMDGQHVRKQ